MLNITRGDTYQELRVSIDEANGVSARYRLHAEDRHLQLFAGAGAFSPALTRRNVDAIVRVSTDLATGGEFWADANGRELKRRQQNARFWHPLYRDPREPGSAFRAGVCSSREFRCWQSHATCTRR